MVDLLTYLQQYDSRWKEVPLREMKTTKPRTLVQYMNTYVARLLAKPELLQKAIDALPDAQDQSAEPQTADKKSLTLSENLSQNVEESKTGENPWDDQACVNSNDQPLSTQKNVRKGSKAGLNKPHREQEHQESSQQAVITPDQ